MNGVTARSKINCAILSPGLICIGCGVSFFIRTIILPLKSLSMTPPLIVVPFKAMLLQSAILMYIPCGSAVDRPVGIFVMEDGGRVIGAVLVTSKPMVPGVAQDGIVAPETSRRICTFSVKSE
jgi:hypothetical protein